MSPISKQLGSEEQYSPFNFKVTPNKQLGYAEGGTTGHINSPGKDSENFDSLFKQHLADMKTSKYFMRGPRHSLKLSNASTSLLNQSFSKLSQGPSQINGGRLKKLKESLKDLN